VEMLRDMPNDLTGTGPAEKGAVNRYSTGTSTMSAGHEARSSNGGTDARAIHLHFDVGRALVRQAL